MPTKQWNWPWIALGLHILITVGSVHANEADPAGPWPQFRGPSGLGHSTATDLPLHWDQDSPNINWRTPLPGEGVSSPIISHEKIFVTTAYKTTQSERLLHKIETLGLLLTVVGWLCWLGRCIRNTVKHRRQQPGFWPVDKESWAVEIFNSLILHCFLCLGVGVTAFPGWLDPILSHVGLWVARVYPDLLKIVTIDPTVEAGIWLTGGAIALIGVAAVGLMVRGLYWRLVIMGALVWGAWQLYQQTPLDQWFEKIAYEERRLFLWPGLLLGGWVLISSFKVHVVQPTTPGRIKVLKKLYQYQLHLRYPRPWHPGESSSLPGALALLLLTGLVFVPGNYWLSGEGITRAVVAVDLGRGDILWHTPVWVDQAERKHSDNSYATPTCATDGQHVLAFFGGLLVCLDQEGQVLWQRRDQDYLENTKYGASSSPLIVDGLAVVLQGKERRCKRPSWLAAFDIEDGKQRWCIYPQEITEGYSTILVYRPPGQPPQLLLHSSYNLNAYRLADGHLLWSLQTPIDQIVAGLALSDSTLIVGGGTYGPEAVMAFDLAQTSEQGPSLQWTTKEGAPGCSSPVIIEDRLYTLSDAGLLTCMDLATGDVHWEHRLKGRHLASLVTGDNKLYAVSVKGVTTVLDTHSRDQAHILASNPLAKTCFATPALVQGGIILRLEDQLIRINGD